MFTILITLFSIMFMVPNDTFADGKHNMMDMKENDQKRKKERQNFTKLISLTL